MTTSHINLADLDGSNGFRLDGVTEYDSSGSSVSDIGDINGDGFDDIVVGAPGADPNGLIPVLAMWYLVSHQGLMRRCAYPILMAVMVSD
jgi:hypothetical protein